MGQLDWFNRFHHIAQKLENNGFYGKIRQFEITPDTTPTFISTITDIQLFSSEMYFITSKKYFLLPHLLHKDNINYFFFYETKFQLSFELPKFFRVIEIDCGYSIICHVSNSKTIVDYLSSVTPCAE